MYCSINRHVWQQKIDQSNVEVCDLSPLCGNLTWQFIFNIFCLSQMPKKLDCESSKKRQPNEAHSAGDVHGN
jgi:hypothetical protein